MKSCLIVDDSSVIRKVARRILAGCSSRLSSRGWRRRSASATSAARHGAARLDMPNMDGYEFLKALRRLPGGDRPKCGLHHENDVAHIARALHAGANEYIMKPFDKEIVEAKFQEVGLI